MEKNEWEEIAGFENIPQVSGNVFLTRSLFESMFMKGLCMKSFVEFCGIKGFLKIVSSKE